MELNSLLKEMKSIMTPEEKRELIEEFLEYEELKRDASLMFWSDAHPRYEFVADVDIEKDIEEFLKEGE